jgi:PAS domain S-box-containing protein
MISGESVFLSANTLGALIQRKDWATTSLGPLESWPQPLKTLTDVMLGSNQPMFVAWGPDRTLLYNDAYAQILAAKHPEALGCDFLDVWAEVRSDLAPIVQEAYSGCAVQMDDIKLIMERRGYSEETHFSFSYTPVRDEAGEIAGFFCPCIETTEQVLSEQRREADAERQRQLFQQAPGFIVILNGPTHVFEFANAAYRRLFGDRQYVGKNVRQAFPELEGQQFFELLDEVYSSGQRYVADRTPIRLRKPDGSQEERFLNFIYEPVVNEANQVTGIFVEGYDVTDAYEAESALRESEARFRLMADAVPQIVWITDGEGRVEFFNKQWTSYTGVPFEPTTASEVSANHVHPEDGAATMAAFEEARGTGRTFAVEHRIRSAQGEYRWFLVRAEPYHDPQTGKIIRWFGASVDIHDRREAELALRKSETRYRTLFDSIESGFCVVEVDLEANGNRVDYRVVEANPAFFRQTGFPVTIEGQWLRKAAPDLEEHWFETYGRVARTGLAERFEQGSDHLKRWFDVFAFPAGAPEERRVGILFNDISARRAVEAQLRESEGRLRELNETLEQRVADALAERQVLASVVESASASILVCDLDFTILAMNRANVDEFERIYGKRPKPGDNFLDQIPTADERARVEAEFAAALNGEESITVKEFGVSGHERVAYELRFSPLSNQDGQFGVVLTAYDVSERVHAEARVAEAEAARREADALYRAYFENSPEALFVIRVASDCFIVEQVNPAHEAGVGFKLDEVRGKRIEEIMPPEASRKVVETYREVVSSGEVYQYREVFDLGGNPQHWDTSIVPVQDATGRVVRLMGSSRNVTAQVFAEDALRHSQKMEAMGNLTGGVAHDFNNLLTPIIGSLDMLQRKQRSDEREQRLISGALQSAERAKTLVQRLLAFARRQPLQPVSINVAKLVTGMAELVGSTTGPQIRVVLEVDEDLPTARGDLNQLEMALLNLSVNARDAMPDGGTLRISASVAAAGQDEAPALAPGDYIRLSVVDTGVGMDDETAKRSVEPFFSTKGVGKGTGLGLSMVHGLAAQLGGALFIHSKAGVGTNVELWLPQSDEAVSTDVTLDPSPSALGRGSVLLVDDEDLVRASTADMLADLGYTVREAGSAEEALRLIVSGETFDLVVTDHLMPGMTGTQLAREVAARKPDLPLLVVSGYAESEGIAPDLPRLTKPYRQSDLAAKLAELVAN